MSDDNSTDYRATVFLPKTDFPMKAGLAQKEPEWLARWERIGLYERLRAARAGRARFLLHDGPPYANGDIHIGHSQNKILKDIVVRTQSLLGKDAPYVPGWDCHGLPIEWKIEEQYRKQGKRKEEVDPVEFRKACRDFAQKWVDIQREQFKRLGVQGDWNDPYLTMSYDAEAAIVEELLKFADSGQLYRGAKPVMWSPVEQTALAEAEVEYHDIVSTQIDVAFEIVDSPVELLKGAYAVIWTTTPWTIPVNRAIAYGADVEYGIYADESGRRFLLAAALAAQVAQRAGLGLSEVATLRGSALAGTVAAHPLRQLGGFFAEPRPLLPGEFVTTDQGTGLVHMAPDHGEDDFWLCKAHGIDPLFVVQPDGTYKAGWPVVGGNHVYKVNAEDGPVCTALREAGRLLAAGKFEHSYPHSWRSKAKLIFRCTPQWFVPMDKPIGSGATLRQTALAAIDETRFVPDRGRNRIRAMVETRPDWVLSRQRAWGVPITLFVNKESGDYLQDPAVNARIVAAVRAGGADAWFTADPQALLGDRYRAEDYEMVTDILDVWFDSGSTHAFVIEARYGKDARADLYLEGSDQHRGWFQSSLLESCGTRGRAPYKAVLTHGFAMDQQGRKMSKSIGNTVDPLDIVKQNGADILRMWVVSVDYSEDVRIGKDVLAGQVDAYRKLRNTFRYLLGALDGFTEAERVAPAEMPELERWVLHRLAELSAQLRQNIEDFDFNSYINALTHFCNQDLSAFYFDIRKDSLYCDAVTSPRRRAVRTVLDLLFHALTRWLSPVLVFTTEEVWQTRFPSEDGSIHLEDWPTIDAAWQDAALGEKWVRLRQYRAAVTGAIEPLRRSKTIGSSLEARVTLGVKDARDAEMIASVPFDEICIVSELAVTPGALEDAFRLDDFPEATVKVEPTRQSECARCWRHLPEVGTHPNHPSLCDRCDEVVDAA